MNLNPHMGGLTSGLLFMMACASPAPEDTGSESTGGEDTGSEDTGSEDTGSEDTGSEDTGSDEEPQDFTGDLRIDLQPGTWPNIIAEGDDIVVAILSRNGFDPTKVVLEEVALWSGDASVHIAAEQDLGTEDVDGDGEPDHLFGFSYSAALFAGSGPVELRTDKYAAWDHFVDDTRTSFVFPELLGPYAVGTTYLEWEDTAREDDRTDELPYRRLPIQIWYPADLPSGAQPSEHYLKRDEGITIANFLGIFSQYFDYLFSHSHLDAPVSEAQERWPVLVFSHGYGVQLPNQTALVQNAASHGFIVVGLQHTYSTAYTLFEDGTLATAYIDPTIDTPATQAMWTEDLRFVLDQVEVLEASDARFGERLDLERMGVFGYSFGGSTAAELCRTDSRVLAGLNIDGTFYGDTEQGFEQDFFLVNASTNFEDGSREPLLNSVAGTAYNLTLSDARHANFNDYALQDEYISELIGGGDPGLGIGSIDSRLAYEIVHQYIAAFFTQYVAGEAASLLDQDSPWDEAEFSVWEP